MLSYKIFEEYTINQLETFADLKSKLCEKKNIPLDYMWYKLTAMQWLKWYIKFKRQGEDKYAKANIKWFIEWNKKAVQKRMGI